VVIGQLNFQAAYNQINLISFKKVKKGFDSG